MQTAQDIELKYFGITGLGECIRATLALSGTAFKDTKLVGEEWGALKATLPPGSQLPIFSMTTADGERLTLHQSRAILRLCGDLTYEGKALYPTDAIERYYCDEAIELVEDFRPYMVPTFAIADQAEKEAARLALIREGGKMWNGLTRLNERLGKFDFCAGNSPSVADAYVVTVCYMFQAPTFIDGFPSDTFEPFPNIVALKNRFCSLPPLAEYYKDADGIRAPFNCGA